MSKIARTYGIMFNLKSTGGSIVFACNDIPIISAFENRQLKFLGKTQLYLWCYDASFVIS
jgi:hypothetical protein